MTDQNQTITPQAALAMYASNWVTPVAVSILASASDYLADPTLSEILVQWATLRKQYEDECMECMLEYLNGESYFINDEESLTNRLEIRDYDRKRANSYHEVLNHFIFRHHSKAGDKE